MPDSMEEQVIKSLEREEGLSALEGPGGMAGPLHSHRASLMASMAERTQAHALPLSL